MANENLENLAKVRDLLFGAEIKEHQLELTRLDEKILEQSSYIREDMRKQIISMEKKLLERFEGLAQRVESDEQRRSGLEDESRQLVKAFGSKLDSGLTEANEKAAHNERELRDQIFSQSNLLSNAITQRHEEAVGYFTAGIAELKVEKADRALLSDVLLDIARRLKPELSDRPAGVSAGYGTRRSSEE